MSKTARRCSARVSAHANSVRRSCHGLRSFHRLRRTDRSVRLTRRRIIAAGRNSGRRPAYNARGEPARDNDQRRMPSLLDQGLVARLVGALEVVEQLAALRHQLEQAAARMVVLHVGLEVLGQVVDALGQDRDLHFGRTGVARLGGIRLDDFGLAVGRNRHRQCPLSFAGAALQAGEVEHALGDDFAAVHFGQSDQARPTAVT